MSAMTIYFCEVIYKNGDVETLPKDSYGASKTEVEKAIKFYNKRENVALARLKTETIMG